jgi:hypothetical protein
VRGVTSSRAAMAAAVTGRALVRSIWMMSKSRSERRIFTRLSGILSLLTQRCQ